MNRTVDFPAKIVPTPQHIRQHIFEREFLIRLAPIWLSCRLHVMGNGGGYAKGTSGWKCPPNLAMDLMGMSDYSAEMELVCREVLS